MFVRIVVSTQQSGLASVLRVENGTLLKSLDSEVTAKKQQTEAQ